jgi:hypothetical protein
VTEAVKRGVESIMNAEKDYLSTKLDLDKSALYRALSPDAVVVRSVPEQHRSRCPRKKLHHGKVRASRRRKGYRIA